VALKFSCHVKEKGKSQVIQITSPSSYPMIVITNESQWGEAAGKLLQAEVYPPGIVNYFIVTRINGNLG
jgi:hypothetical protein